MSDELGKQVSDLVNQVQRWTAAANRLFAIGTVDDEAYMEAVRLVGVALAPLRDHCATVESLVAAGPEVHSLLEDAVRENPPAAPMDLGSLVDAARGVRYGEIASLTAADTVISHK